MNLIVTHDHGDFDALAAAVCAAKLYPGSAVILPEPLRANVQAFVDLHSESLPLAESGKPGQENPTLAVVVATRKKSRLGPYLDTVQRAGDVHIFDHHQSGPDDLEGSEVRVEPVGAVTTMLLEEIRLREVPLNEFEATLLLLGIYEDTGCLTYGTTTARDVSAAAYLWEQGVISKEIREHLHVPVTVPRKRLLEKLLENSEYCELHGRSVLLNTASADEYVEGAAGLFRYLQDAEDVELAVILVPMDKHVYLSARSTADDINLAELLAPLGAKGSARAVSATAAHGDLQSIKEQLMELLGQFIPQAATAAQVSSSPVAQIDVATSVDRALEFLEGKGVSGCPVMEQERMAGMISRRELRKARHSNLGHAAVRSFMRRQFVTASPGDSLTALRRLMAEHNLKRIPIVGAGGEPVGIVTRSDILRALYRLDRRGGSVVERGKLCKVLKSPPVTEVDNLAPLINRELPARLQSLLLTIGRHAQKAEVELYLVGGVIRDLLLGRPLPHDLDFIVLPDAIAFARKLASFLGGSLKEFEQFGTASLFLDKGLRLDLATARKEFYAAPAALPRVETSTLRNDLYRRDFTINTLACSLQPDTFGSLHDFFGGREDLSRGVIRTLYNLSFVDDPLRILRAARFTQRFGFAIEENTMELIRKAIAGKVLDKLSRPRLNHELSLIYREPDPARVLKQLNDMGALPLLYPYLHPTMQVWQRLNRIGETLNWAKRRDWESIPDPELVYLSGLFYDLSPDERSVILRRLHFSREKTGTVLATCQTVPALLEEMSRESMSPSMIVNRLDPLPVEALLLMHALAGCDKIKSYLLLYLNSLQHVRSRIKGGDLKQLGLEPGPLYQEILQVLRDAVLDGTVRGNREEWDFILSYVKQIKEKEGKPGESANEPR